MVGSVLSQIVAPISIRARNMKNALKTRLCVHSEQ